MDDKKVSILGDTNDNKGKEFNSRKSKNIAQRIGLLIGGMLTLGGSVNGQNNEVAVATPGQLNPSGLINRAETNTNNTPQKTNVPVLDEIIISFAKHKIKIEQAHQKLITKRGEIAIYMRDKAELYRKAGNMQAMADYLGFFETLKTNKLSLNPTEYDQDAYKRQKMSMEGQILKEKVEIEATKRMIAIEMSNFAQSIRGSGKRLDIQKDSAIVAKVVALMNLADKASKPENIDSGIISLNPYNEFTKEQGVQLTGSVQQKDDTTREIPQEPTGTNLVGSKFWPITNTAGLTLASPQGGEIKMLPNGNGLLIKASPNKGGANYIRKKMDIRGGDTVEFSVFFQNKEDMTGIGMTVSLLDETGTVIQGSVTSKNLDQNLDGSFQVQIPKEIETFDPKKPGKAIKVKPAGLYFDVIIMHAGNSDYTKSPAATLQGIHARKVK